MKNLASVRPAAILVAVLGIVVIGLGGVALSVHAPQDQVIPAVEQATDGGVCPADRATDEVVSEDMAPGGNPCKNCKRPNGKHGCARLSCDPCCCVCQGEPLPRCTS